MLTYKKTNNNQNNNQHLILLYFMQKYLHKKPLSIFGREGLNQEAHRAEENAARVMSLSVVQASGILSSTPAASKALKMIWATASRVIGTCQP